MSRMKALNPGPLAIDSIVKIYQVILDESIRTQQQYGFGSHEGRNSASPGAPKKSTRARKCKLRKTRAWHFKASAAPSVKKLP